MAVRTILHYPDARLREPGKKVETVSAELRQLIDDMADDGKTVVMCTHLLLEAEGLADQVVVIGKGRLIAEMPIEEFTSLPSGLD